MNNFKICLVSDTIYDLNGVSRFIQDFSKEALKNRKEFHIISSSDKKPYENIDNIFNIKPIFKIRMPFYKSLDLVFPNFFKIKKKLKEINPSLIHISTPGTVGICALISAKILKIPVVGIYHTDFPEYLYKNTNSKIIRFITIMCLKLFYNSFQALFSRSEDYLKVIQKQLNFNKKDLYLLKAGIDIKNFDKIYKDNSIWKKYGVDEKRFKVLYVGRISLEKNVDKLLQIWQKGNFKNCQLILVGDKEIKGKIKEDSITLLGRKQGLELSKLYASSDCFIFPSTTDTLGQVVMEAMASALPVIITNKGGPKTFVKEEFGYILDIDLENEYIKTIKELAKKDEKYYSKKNKAYEAMREKSISHSFLDFWQKNIQIFQSLKTRN